MTREAAITIEIGDFRVSEVRCYDPAQEEKVLMGLARDRIKEGVREKYGRFAAGFVPKGNKLMQEIVSRANQHFRWQDPQPDDWAEFKAWAIRRDFLRIREV